MSVSEPDIQGAVEAGELSRAIDLTLDLYGAKLFGYLVNVTASRDLASDLFQELSVALWQGLESFEWRSSLQTWVFVIARRTWLQHARRRETERFTRLDTQEAADLEDRVRTRTEEWRKTTARSALADAVQELDPKEREILNLRINQKLAWNDIALVLHDDADSALVGPHLSQEAARVRKRFQRLKDGLRKKLRPTQAD